MSELTIETIPREMFSYILSFLSATELAICCGTNSLFYGLGSHSSLWRNLCQLQWPEQFNKGGAGDDLSISQLNQTYINKETLFWKRYFITKYLIEVKKETLSWTQISLSSSSVGSVKPSPRYAHSGTVIENKIVYIGGQFAQKQRFNDFFFYDTENGHFTNAKPKGNPPNISKHTTMEIDGIFYIFGGYDGIDQRFELSTFDPRRLAWETPTTFGDRPTSRSNHASAVIGKKMYLFGGLLQQGRDLIDSNDLYELDVTNMTWTILTPTGDIPEPRCGHKLVAIDDKLYLFGGGNGDNWSNKFNDLHIYDPSMNTWSKPETSGCFVDSTTFASLFAIGRFLFVFGGGKITNRGCVSNDIYTFDTVTRHWTKQSVFGKAPGERDDCTTNVVGDVVYLMHGYNSGPIDEFWSIKMNPSLYRTVYQKDPPVRVIKESHSPLLQSLSPSLKRMKQKLISLSPFTRRYSSNKA